MLADTVTVLVDLPDGEMVVLKQVRHPTDLTVSHIMGKSGVRFLGIEALDHIMVSPPGSEVLHEGDFVIVAGNTEQLKKFIRIF